MKYRVALLSPVLVAILAVTAACSTNTSPSGSQTGQTASPSTTTTAPAKATQAVTITVFDDRIESSLATFTVGTPYHFVVTNKGHSEYAFSMMSPDREQEMEHMSRGDWQHATLHMDDHLMPGQTSSFDYTFDATTIGHHLEFACYSDGQSTPQLRLPFTPESHD
jgi:uncharacterized cupredoxin-like copper-binding protein